MAIVVLCPSCDREMKVKDELAGKKIKCPGCGEAIAVLKKQATAQARSVKKRDVEDDNEQDEDDEPEEEARPRKKKKQKAKGMSMLVIGLVAGGVGLIVVVVAVVLGVIFLGGKGGAKDGKTDVAQQQQKIGSRAQGAGRAMPVADISMQLKLIGLAYNNWFDSGKTVGPKNAAELGKAMQNSQSWVDLIESNKITVVWGISKDAFRADLGQIIAWETQPDRNGIRLALEALGAPLEMNEAELQAAKKAKSS